MKRKTSRRTAVLVLLTMIMTLIPEFAGAVTWQYEEAPPEFAEILMLKDGTDLEDITGTGYSVVKDSNQNDCFKLGNATYITQLMFNFDRLLEEGVPLKNEDGQCMISFDIQAKQTNKGIQLLFSDTEGVGYSPFQLSGGGKMYLNQASGTTPSAKYLPPTNVRDYEAEKWYNIKMVYYTRESYIDYYVDDVYWTRQELPRPRMFNDLYVEDVGMQQIFFNYRPDWELDENGQNLTATATGEIWIDNFTYGIPKQRDIELDFWKNETGNIYDANDVNFGCDIINRTDKTQKFTLTYDIRTDKNKAIKKGSNTYEIKPGNRKSVTLLDYAPEHGFYAADVELYDSNNQLLIKDQERFSIISHQDGVNERVGFNIHNAAHGDSAYGYISEVLNMVEKLGVGNTRDVYAWYSQYENDGETRSATVTIDLANNAFPKTSVIEMAILRILQEARTMAYDDPAVPDLLKRWGKYCYTIASDLNDSFKYFEIENEWWLLGDINKNGVKYDVNVSPDVRLYADMIKIAAENVRKAKPDAKIIILNSSLLSLDWTRAVLDALGDNPGQHFDILAIHDYMTAFTSFYPEHRMEFGEEGKGGAKTEMLEIFKEYGLEDKPIWSTEFGVTTGYYKYDIDEKLKADYYMRQLMLDLEYMEKAYIYQLQLNRFTESSNDYENGFGMVTAGTKGEIRQEALPAAVELAAYNTLLKDSTAVSRQVIGSDGLTGDSQDIYVYKNKTAGGKDCYALFTLTGEKDVSFDFGVSAADVYDEYGNKTTLSALDGYITLHVSQSPQYVVAGDLKDNVTVRENPLFTMTTEVQATRNDEFLFEVEKDTNAYTKINIECSANTEIKAQKAATAKKTSITVTTFDDVQEIEQYRFEDGVNKEEMIVSIGNGSKVYYREPLKIEYVSSLESNMRIVPYRNGRWQVMLQLKNNRRTSPLSGIIDISTGDSEEIKNLLSGQKSTIRFNIPEDVKKTNYTVNALITLDDGSVVTQSADTNFLSVERAVTPPTIDGRIEKGEWKNSGTLITLNKEDQYVRLDKNVYTTNVWKGEADLSGEMYTMYDDKYFYFAAKVQDDVHCGTANDVWAMDSIQFGIAKELVNSSAYTELAMSLDDSGKSLLKKYKDANEAEVYFDKTKINEFDEGTELKVVRDGNYTIYELQIPWTELTNTGYKPEENLLFSALINENDGYGRNSFMEWGSGIGNGKDPSKYIKIPINK